MTLPIAGLFSMVFWEHSHFTAWHDGLLLLVCERPMLLPKRFAWSSNMLTIGIYYACIQVEKIVHSSIKSIQQTNLCANVYCSPLLLQCLHPNRSCRYAADNDTRDSICNVIRVFLWKWQFCSLFSSLKPLPHLRGWAYDTTLIANSMYP